MRYVMSNNGDDNYKCSDLSENCALHQSVTSRLVAFDTQLFFKIRFSEPSGRDFNFSSAKGQNRERGLIKSKFQKY